MHTKNNILLKSSSFKKLFLVLIGLGLCFAIPIFPLGPSFVIWPSFSEIAGFLLLLMAINAFIYLRRDKSPNFSILTKQIIPAGIFVLCYIVFITILFTFYNQFSIIYPMWSLVRLVQWVLIILYVLFLCRPQYLKFLAIGIVIGGVINAAVSILQKFGFLSPADIFTYLNVSGGGPYQTIIQSGGIAGGGSIGLFSYSRTATGFLLVLSFFATMLFLRKSSLRIFALLFFTLGVAFTGSRLGFLMLAFMMLTLFFHRKFTAAIFGTIFLVFILMIVFFPVLINDFALGRLIGVSETYTSGIEQRFVRQMKIFDIPEQYLLFGCGIGNLGNVLELPGMKFYRAHGYFFTYLAEVGAIGVILLSLFVHMILKSCRAFRSYFGWIVLGVIVLLGFMDDFMIPCAQAAHLPLIAAIVLRFSILKTEQFKNKEIKINGA